MCVSIGGYPTIYTYVYIYYIYTYTWHCMAFIMIFEVEKIRPMHQS